jgi:hypothetical protein
MPLYDTAAGVRREAGVLLDLGWGPVGIGPSVGAEVRWGWGQCGARACR